MEKTAIDKLLSLIDAFASLAEGKVPLTSRFYVRVWGPYDRGAFPGDKRQIVSVIDKDGKKRTISLPKFLYEEATGIRLKPNETIDHKDYDIDNNDINNLQVIDRSEHSKMDTRRVKLHKFVCGECGKEFERSPRLARDKHRKGVSGIFCSRQCAGRYSRKVQLGLIDKLPLQQHVDSEYYTLKGKPSLAELAESFIVKHAFAI
jgi:hypothetical protein